MKPLFCFKARGGAMLKDTVFVLVAGGLGERLGFDGIKVALPAETLSGATFLEIYCTALRAIEEREGGGGVNSVSSRPLL